MSETICPNPECREDLIKSRVSKWGFFSTAGAIVAALGILISVAVHSYSVDLQQRIVSSKDNTIGIAKNQSGIMANQLSIIGVTQDVKVMTEKLTNFGEKQQDIKNRIVSIELNQQKVLQELVKLNTLLKKEELKSYP